VKDREEKDLALKGMRRAAVKAHERAARFGLKLPVWRDGAIVFINPELKAHPEANGTRLSARCGNFSKSGLDADKSRE
jgi:hypothetical protein